MPPAAVPASTSNLNPSMDLVVAAGRERMVLISGVLAGICVFFAPLLVLALGLLGAYLANLISDGAIPVFDLARPLAAEDFRAVFAPAINEAPLLVTAAILGGVMAQFRRWHSRRADPAFLAAGIRPFFPEFSLLYVLLVGLTLGMAATHGGSAQLQRLVGAAPVYLPFMLCGAWLTHSVWNYCFRNIVDLLASPEDRDAATTLRGRARLLRTRARSQ